MFQKNTILTEKFRQQDHSLCYILNLIFVAVATYFSVVFTFMFHLFQFLFCPCPDFIMVPAENRDISQYGNKEDTQRVTEVEGWRAWNEGYAKVPDDFTITLKAPTSTTSTHLRHYLLLGHFSVITNLRVDLRFKLYWGYCWEQQQGNSSVTV